MTLFGIVVEKGELFKGLPSTDDDAGYYAVCSCSSVWTLDSVHCVYVYVCIINNFLPTKQGVGWEYRSGLLCNTL